MTRTLVISDLHLGTPSDRDVLRRPAPLAELCAHVSTADRLVLLGDTLELRLGPSGEAVARAAPTLAALADALGPDGELLLVAGNHDHALVAGWLEGRGGDARAPRLGLEQRVPRGATPLAARVEQITGGRATFAYPGVWLRDDVYALHGHYLDRVFTMPTFERLVAGAMGRLVGSLPDAGAGPDDFEAALAPIYAWVQAVAQRRPGHRAGEGASTSMWQTLTDPRPRDARTLAIRAAFPLAVRALNGLGLGPLGSTVSAVQLRRAGLGAIGEVVERLGVDAAHVIFGHTHRAGPLPGDDLREWRAPGGAQLHNAGAWVSETLLVRGGPDSPYWAGRGVWLDDDGPPRVARLVTELGVPAVGEAAAALDAG